MSTLLLIRNRRAYCGVELTQPDSVVQRFARTELQRLTRRCFGVALAGRHPMTIRLESGHDEADGFRITQSARGIDIHGNNDRSLLFAVYAFLKRYAGCRWFEPDEEIAPQQRELRVSLPRPWSETPTIAQRYIFPERKDFSCALMKRFIAWAPRNTIGDITISFDAWAAWKEALIPELSKRGLGVILSGHGLDTFVPRTDAMLRRHPRWFAKIGGTRVARGQYCFSSSEFRRHLAQQMTAFVRANRAVSRLSIWAEDTALNCECRACRETGFLKSFIRSMNEVAAAVAASPRGVAVDFLAYNAALAWDMLEPVKGLQLDACGTQIAYWGRDYRYGLQESRLAADRRGLRSMRAWRKITPGTVSILEYYTDIWMLTHLIPPMPRRIARDCAAFAEMGVDSVGTLICLAVPTMRCRGNLLDRFAAQTYPNLYFFAASAWNARLPVNALLQDYADKRFGKDASLCLGYLRELEKTLPEITSFNQSMFRLRFVDIWERDETPDEGGIQFRPQDWTPDRHWNNEERRRYATCRRLDRRLTRFEKRHGWKLMERDPACRERSRALRDRWLHVRGRLHALSQQLEAQEAMSKGDVVRARRILEAALDQKRSLLEPERKTCRHWLRKLRAE